MWPFTKKKQIEINPAKAFDSVLCIPGNWNSRDELSLLIVASTNGEYLLAGNILMNAKINRHYSIDFCKRDERMEEAFKYAGMVNKVTDTFINEIGTHKYVVYITGTTGSFEEAEHIARAGLAVLKAGGLGIKVETAGKAFEKNQWGDYLENFGSASLYEMFVVESIYNKANNSTYSCGMQNIGLKDTIIFDEEFQESVKLIRIFSFYQIEDNPTIQNNQTFNPLINSSIFRISDESNQPYKGDKMFENPFGMWRLSRL